MGSLVTAIDVKKAFDGVTASDCLFTPSVASYVAK